ncbi:YagU family protein [Companilactobacillus mishanensis]|uniref:DUF1440 domain-containing protein n=1 Tax=Companilactobacillus mishanensis TaxID=2486008 RepID=A0ABW9P9K5_9LACO|nr:DUF1440 domain-containing protein [Companilactobacillus mishanensis]MQS45884.1 DUF1440 domain-containing protein [Companilactobacillus mishanensis]
MNIAGKRQPRIWAAVIAGILGGIMSGIVKLGWEVLLPPRTIARNLTNPPQELLQQFGMPEKITHLTYTYSGQQMPWVSFIMHFGFSITFAIIYCVLAEYFPKVKMGQGTVYGIVIWIAFHLLIMPLMGTVPAVWNQPLSEHFSEALGHAVWAWTIEVFRRDFRNRITHEPDREVETGI